MVEKTISAAQERDKQPSNIMWGNENLCISWDRETTSIHVYHVWNSQPLYLMRGINSLHTRKYNIRVSWEINEDHISYDNKTTLIFYERDRQLPYHVRKRQYLYLIRGMNNLHISCEEMTTSGPRERDNPPKTTIIFQEVDRQLPYHVRKRQPLYFVRGITIYKSCEEQTSFISQERDVQPSYLLSHMRKRQYLYLIRGIPSLYI